jgi:hypothetical protein
VALAGFGQRFVDDAGEQRQDRRALGLQGLSNPLINVVEVERVCRPCALALLAPFAFLTSSCGRKPCILLVVPCAPLGDAGLSGTLFSTVIPGCAARRRPQMRNCTLGNLEIPGSIPEFGKI